jgi:phosphoglycerate dehydrogenase-like enzyme
MATYQIYVTEPEAIDLDIVRSTLGDTEYTLMAGDPTLTAGNPASCDTLLIRSGTHVNAALAAKMPQLAHVVRVGVGLDNVDLTYCEQHNITVYNAPGANADAVAEYAVAVILLAMRRIHLLEPGDLQTWNRFKFTGHSLGGRKVGIIGFGHIGKLLYAKLRALGASEFLVYDPYIDAAPESARLATIEEIMSQCTVISLHLPLLESTAHIIDAAQLARIQEGTIILNASRGGIVDETAVVAALATKYFTYIADTVEGEPTVNPILLDQPNILLTPHIASLTVEAEQAMVRVSIQNLLSGTVAAKLPA